MIVPEEIEAYIEAHTTPENEVLHRLNRHTHVKVLQPNMLSGHVQGRFLSMLSKLMQPSRILEIGTYTGYSAICLAEGLCEDGKLITIDKNDELEASNSAFFRESGLDKKIEMHIGNAMDIVPGLTETFDIVFIDADKANYLNYFNMVIDKVRKGGLIIADNTLWKGRLTDPSNNDRATNVIKAFNDHVHNDNRVENVLLSIRDGLFLLRKI